MDAMTIPDLWSGQDRALMIVSPAPSTLHRLAVTRLAVLLSAACPVIGAEEYRAALPFELTIAPSQLVLAH